MQFELGILIAEVGIAYIGAKLRLGKWGSVY